MSSVELGEKCSKAPTPQIAERLLKSTSLRKEPFIFSAGNKASAVARWLLLWITLFVPSCEVTHSEGHLLQALALKDLFPQLNTLLI